MPRIRRSALVSLLALPLLAATPALADDQVFDEEGRVIRTLADDGTWTDFSYDEEGRLVAEEDSDGTVVRYWYDEDGVRHEVVE